MEENDSNESSTIIIDAGSDITKAGIGGEDSPSVLVPSFIGQWESSQNERKQRGEKSKVQSNAVGKNKGPMFVGSRLKFKDELPDSLMYPIQNGQIKSWKYLEKLWQRIIDEDLPISPNNEHATNMILGLSPILYYGEKKNKMKMAEIMFESMGMDRLDIQCTSTLSLYASGRRTAMVVDLGESRSFTVPIFEGCVIPHARMPLTISGSDITDHLMNLINNDHKTGHQMNTLWDKETVKEIKENHCSVPLDENEDFNAIKQVEYTFPDGEKIILNREQQRCGEALFQPHLIRKDSPGIHHIILDSILACDRNIQRAFYSNILVTGGTTMFSGFTQRLETEIQNSAPNGRRNVDVISPSNRWCKPYSSWIGGSVLSCLSQFREASVTKKEWQEQGPHHLDCDWLRWN